MNTISRHLSSYPKARSSTLAYLIQRERMTAQLRKEVEARRKPWLRLLRALRMWGR